jgi:hypothetical protein
MIHLFEGDENGGSEITQYELQYDDGERGDFKSVYQLSTTLIITEGVIAGASYRTRYRAKNFNGWGPISDINYVLAATAPPKPFAPVRVSSTASEIEFLLTTSENTSGSEISEYNIYFDRL